MMASTFMLSEAEAPRIFGGTILTRTIGARWTDLTPPGSSAAGGSLAFDPNDGNLLYAFGGGGTKIFGAGVLIQHRLARGPPYLVYAY